MGQTRIGKLLGKRFVLKLVDFEREEQGCPNDIVNSLLHRLEELAPSRVGLIAGIVQKGEAHHSAQNIVERFELLNRACHGLTA